MPARKRTPEQEKKIKEARQREAAKRKATTNAVRKRNSTRKSMEGSRKALPAAGKSGGSKVGPRRQLKSSTKASGKVRIGNSSQPWGDKGVKKVTVRDVTQKQMTGSSQKALPPSKRLTAAQQKKAAAQRGTRGPNRVGQPAGAANRMYGANVVDQSVKRAVRSTAARNLTNGLKGGIAGLALMAGGQAAVNYVGQKGGTALGKGIKRLVKGEDNKAKSGSRAGVANPKDLDYGQGDYKSRLKAKPGTTPKPSRTSSSSSSSSSRSSAPAPKARTSSAPSKAPGKTSTKKSAIEDKATRPYNPNASIQDAYRGTSKSSNPLIQKDAYLSRKVKEREDKEQGPVANAAQYAATVERQREAAKKKKEDEKKKKARTGLTSGY